MQVYPEQWNDPEFGSTKFGEVIQAPYQQQFGLHKHSSAREVREQVGEAVWADYFTFAFVRHPLAHAVSLYTYIRELTQVRRAQRMISLNGDNPFWDWKLTKA